MPRSRSNPRFADQWLRNLLINGPVWATLVAAEAPRASASPVERCTVQRHASGFERIASVDSAHVDDGLGNRLPTM